MVGSIAPGELIALLALGISTLGGLIAATYKVGHWVGDITRTVGDLANKVDAIGREVKTGNGTTIAETVEKVATTLGVGNGDH